MNSSCVITPTSPPSLVRCPKHGTARGAAQGVAWGVRLLGHEGAVGGSRKDDKALDVLPANRALGDEPRARLAHSAVAAGPSHRNPRLRLTDEALSHGTLL